MKDNSYRAGLVQCFGVETEFHVTKGGIPVDTAGFQLPPGSEGSGEVDSDAGVGLAEAMGAPANSFSEAVQNIDRLLKACPGDWEKCHTVWRPESIQGQPEWAKKKRYDALINAAKRECPNGWEAINQMVGVASTHLNMSGVLFDPIAPEGQFIMNVLRNLAPFIAARIHAELNDGFGHLGIWTFADERRMPTWSRWHIDFESFREEFEGKTKFIQCVDEQADEWTSNPRGNCSIYDPVDLGTNWDVVRPKRIPRTNRHYLELRFLPAMTIDSLDVYGRAVHSIVEMIHQWHEANYDLQPVTREEAKPLFPWLYSSHPDLLPNEMLTREDWEAHLKL